MKCLLIQPQSGASQTLWLPAAHLHNALLATLFNCFSHDATNLRNSWSSFLSPLLVFSHFLLSFTSLIFFNNSHLYNYVLAIFWLQRIERRLRFYFNRYNRVTKLSAIKRSKSVFASVTSKMRRAHFPNECAFFTFLPFPSSIFLSFLTSFHFSHLLQ